MKTRCRPPMIGLKPYIIRRVRQKGIVWEGRLRGSKDLRYTVGVFRTREEALDACEKQIASGVRERVGKRGPKKGCQMPRRDNVAGAPSKASPAPSSRGPVAAQSLKPCGDPTLDRIEMMKRILQRLG